MPKDLTTRERNEIIGLAIDLNADVYNKYLNDFVDTRICEKGKSDAAIAAAVICLSTWGDSEEPYGYADDFVQNGDTEHYRWNRSVVKYEPEKLVKLDIFVSEEKAKKAINKINN